jgi:hypothetical protein
MALMPCHVKIRPVKVYGHDPLLKVSTRRTVAYRAVCSCGARSPARARVSLVRGWLREHQRAGGVGITKSDAARHASPAATTPTSVSRSQ